MMQEMLAVAVIAIYSWGVYWIGFVRGWSHYHETLQYRHSRDRWMNEYVEGRAALADMPKPPR